VDAIAVPALDYFDFRVDALLLQIIFLSHSI